MKKEGFFLIWIKATYTVFCFFMIMLKFLNYIPIGWLKLFALLLAPFFTMFLFNIILSLIICLVLRKDDNTDIDF